MLEKWYNLRMFDGDGDAAGDQGKGGSGDQGKGDKPFISFPDEASFMSRLSRESQKQVKEFLKSLGFEKEDDLKGLVEAARANEQRDKTELEKFKEAAERAAKERDDALTNSQKIALNSEAKVQALSLGVDSSKVNYVLKLADLSDIKVENGNVDSNAVKAAIQAVLKDVPELVKKQGSSKGGEDFSGKDQDDKLLSHDIIKSMSPQEAEKRMPEIMAFLEKNPFKK